MPPLGKLQQFSRVPLAHTPTPIEAMPNLSAHRSAILLNDGDGVFSELADAGVETSQPTAATAAFAARRFEPDGLDSVAARLGWNFTVTAAASRRHAIE